MFAAYLLKTKKEYKKNKETKDSRYIYQNELHKACFQQHLAYRDFQDLRRTAASYKVLPNNTFNIVKNPKHEWYQRGVAIVVQNIFDKMSSCGIC